MSWNLDAAVRRLALATVLVAAAVFAAAVIGPEYGLMTQDARCVAAMLHVPGAACAPHQDGEMR